MNARQKIEYWLTKQKWTQAQAELLLNLIDPDDNDCNFVAIETNLAIEKAIKEGKLIPDEDNLFTPLDIVKWASLERWLPTQLKQWLKEQTSQPITVDDLTKLFDTPTPTLEQVAAKYFNITTKAEANRRLEWFRAMFDVYKPEGANSRASYLVNLESLAAYLNKSSIK